MKRQMVATLAILALLWMSIPAFAHAFLENAVPAVGSRSEKSPEQVRLRFTEKVEAGSSSVRVLDSQGARVDEGNARANPSDPAVLIVDLKPLAPGAYRVIWRAQTADGHVTEGDFTFEVAP